MRVFEDPKKIYVNVDGIRTEVQKIVGGVAFDNEGNAIDEKHFTGNKRLVLAVDWECSPNDQSKDGLDYSDIKAKALEHIKSNPLIHELFLQNSCS